MNNWKLRFAVLWAGQAISTLTSAVMQMALIWHLAISTSSAMVLSIASLAAFAPMALLGTIAGTLVDRWNRKLTMIGADIFIALIALGLGLFAFFAEVPVWLIIVVLAVRSIGTAFHTPAISAVTPLLVPEDELTRCAGYTQTVQSVGFIAGTSLAAVLYPIWGLRGMVLLDVAGAILAAATVVMVAIPSPPLPDKVTETAAESTLEGGRFSALTGGFAALRAHRGIWLLLWSGAIFMLAYSPINALFPLMSLGHFNGTTTHASVAEVVFASGMIIGGLLLGLLGNRINRGVTMCLAMTIMGLAILGSGLLPATGFIGFAVAATLMGLVVPFYTGPYTALIQEEIAPEYLGRVFGTYGSIMSAAMALGLVISGPLADTLGVTTWFIISGLIIIALSAISIATTSIRTTK